MNKLSMAVHQAVSFSSPMTVSYTHLDVYKRQFNMDLQLDFCQKQA